MNKPRHKKWAYQNTAFLLASALVVVLLADTPMTYEVIRHIGSYGYLGAVVTGIFFVSTFTVVPAALVLFHLAQEYNPILIALTAGAGSVLGDLLIFRLFKSHIFEELEPLIHKIKKFHIFELFKSRHFRWLTPVIGAIIIALPFPDEVGIGMMGLSKIKEWQFIILTYVLNVIGILMIVLYARV